LGRGSNKREIGLQGQVSAISRDVSTWSLPVGLYLQWVTVNRLEGTGIREVSVGFNPPCLGGVLGKKKKHKSVQTMDFDQVLILIYQFILVNILP
jgi:hypothetical protein